MVSLLYPECIDTVYDAEGSFLLLCLLH